jgi:hypothetical protein
MSTRSTIYIDEIHDGFKSDQCITTVVRRGYPLKDVSLGEDRYIRSTISLLTPEIR